MAKKPNGPTLRYTILAAGSVAYEGVGNNYGSMIGAVEPILRKGVEILVFGEDEQTAFNVKSALILHTKHPRWRKDFKAGWRSHQDRVDGFQFKVRWTAPKPNLKKKPEQPRSYCTFFLTPQERVFLETSLQGLRSM